MNWASSMAASRVFGRESLDSPGLLPHHYLVLAVHIAIMAFELSQTQSPNSETSASTLFPSSEITHCDTSSEELQKREPSAEQSLNIPGESSPSIDSSQQHPQFPICLEQCENLRQSVPSASIQSVQRASKHQPSSRIQLSASSSAPAISDREQRYIGSEFERTGVGERAAPSSAQQTSSASAPVPPGSWRQQSWRPDRQAALSPLIPCPV